MTEEDPNIGAAPAVTRRTIVKGAAWTIPVVAVAVAAPQASASVATDPRVEFLRPAYTADPCAPLTGVRVKAWDDATTPAAAGSPIVVTLPEGFAFPNGSRTTTVTAGADGTATLPTITVTSPDDTVSFSAQYSGATGATQVTVDSSERGVWGRMTATGGWTAFPAVPAASSPQGYNYFVGPGGALWYNNAQVANAGGVVGGGAWQTADPTNNRATIKNNNGVWFQVNGSTRTSNLDVPSDYVSRGNGYFQSPGVTDPDLVYTTTDGGARTEFSVDGAPQKVSAYDMPGVGNVVTFYAQRTLANGSVVSGWWRVVNGDFANIQQLTNVPADARNLGYDYFQSGSTLYVRNTATIVNAPTSTSVPGIKTFMGTSDNPRVNVRDPQGRWHSASASQLANRDWGTTFADVPSNATPLGYNYFLDKQGRLWSGNTVIQTGVARAAVGFSGLDSSNLVNIKLRQCV
ncbi:hypothetical protein [Microbacterium sp. SLBN-111]|uniref:hypothetical protein n=1 Tax=Microbacterium sp. SLBN-111 TaxID=3377733 RepID=UPI003C76D32E